MNEKLQGFHVTRLARDRYQFEEAVFTYFGKAHITNFHAARGFATKMNQKRSIANFPNQVVQPSQINAIALIQGITHYVFRQYCERHFGLLQTALNRLAAQFGPDLDKTLTRYVDEFPPQPVYRREATPPLFLSAEFDNRPNRETSLEELVMLWIANANPAFLPFHELFGDDTLKKETAYPRITTELNAFFSEFAKGDAGDGEFPGGMSIFDILLAPIKASPYSLEGQLQYLIGQWGGTFIGTDIFRLLTAIDIVREELRAIPGPGGPGGKGSTPVPFFEHVDFEAEAYTPDREWMPNLVLIAKNSYVWLDQLTKKYGREINRLDQIPDEELDQLARWGITGLWLIGLWERSTASQRIKVMCGNPDAVASAYSLYDYQIAARLGGEAACNHLRERAWKRGIRLASDMVPNHVGIDGKWVAEHPDWFVSVDYSPYPSYSFNGPNLSTDSRLGIYLEDHYYDRTDAAVVFRRVDNHTGETRYVYHGNDGTSMPWNDTAQLNYLNPDVREAMVQTILNIAKQFPIIRFDAAMTLVKKHIQRLWFPEPGSGSGIPSRAVHGITRAEFDKLMPEEFWREVVDRAAVEAPDTLLLAEAFWLLEGYFVRTLGMHRVYNSAFMNMLRDEENLKYRSVIKNTIEFDPEVLRRYVNFLNNPDEKTAVEQFGKGDKYFGICMLMVTMPGLPMLGHGQIEGFAEKYGMEYYRAYWDEQPDTYLIQRHEREIFPLCRKRYLFAGVENFLLYDFYTSDGKVDENVFAYSNCYGDERGLILYNNAVNQTRGSIKMSAAYSVKTGEGDERKLIQRTVGEGLALPADDDQFCIYRDHRAGLEYLRTCRDLVADGLAVELQGYQSMVLIDFRIVRHTEARPYRELAAYLGGRGVPNVDEAMREITLQPVRTPIRELINETMIRRVLAARTSVAPGTSPASAVGHADPSAAGRADLLDEVERKTVVLVEAIQVYLGDSQSRASRPAVPQSAVPMSASPTSASQAGALTTAADTVIEADSGSVEETTEISPAHDPEAVRIAATVRASLDAILTLPGAVPAALQPVMDAISADDAGAATWGGLYSWLIVRSLDQLEPHLPGQARSWIDEWLLGRLVAAALQGAGVLDMHASQQVTAIKLAVGQAAMFAASGALSADEILEVLLGDPDAQQLLNVNHFQGVVWFNQEGFEKLVQWLVLLAQVNQAASADAAGERPLADPYAAIERLWRAAQTAGYQVDKLRARVRSALPTATPTSTTPTETTPTTPTTAKPATKPATT
jgi:glycosidase